MIGAPYMNWAKHRPSAANDLAASGIRPVGMAELLGPDVRAADVLSASGPNDDGYGPLVEAIAAAQGVGAERIACAAGTSGANALAVFATVGAGDDVLIERPAYDPLIGLVGLAGARIRRIERRFEDGFQIDPHALARALTPATRLVVLTNPHNPSGAVIDREALRAIGEAATRVDARVLVDEVYRMAGRPGCPVPASAATLDGPFVVTNSLTKAWGLPGLRVGWVAADPAIAERVRRVRDLLDVIGAFPAEQLGVVAFQQLDRLTARTSAILGEQWPIVEAALRACPALEYVVPQAGMIVFPRFRDGRSSEALVDRLRRDHDTLVVPGRLFEAPAHVRIAFGGARDVVERGAAALVAACASA